MSLNTGASIIVLAACLVASGIAAAQQAGDASSTGSASGEVHADQLETIVVTAQKRAEQIKEVPYSISAISGTLLREQHIETFEDIARTIPGLSFGAGGTTGEDTITMRGVSSQGGGATVGLYLDDIPIVTQTSYAPPSPTSGATQPKLFDLDRVEVLRGPQGTLYGAGSMGGAIRFITKAPDPNQMTESFTTQLSGTEHGGVNYDEMAIVNLPVATGVAALRVGLDYGEESGYIDRYKQVPLTEAQVLAGDYSPAKAGLIESGTNIERTLAGRISGLYWVNDDIEITPSIFAQRLKADDTSLFYPFLGLYDTDKLVPERSSDSMAVPSLTVKADLGWADLTSITSYFWRRNWHVSDGTFFNSDFIQFLADVSPDLGYCQCGVAFTTLPGPSFSTEQTQTTTQEVRLTSKLPADTGLPISWVVGAFVSDRKIRTTEYDYIYGIRDTFFRLYGVDPANTSFADPFLNDLAGFNRGREDQRQYAGYGEVTVYVTPAFKLTAGLRLLTARTAYTFDNGGYFGQGIPPEVAATNRYYATTPKFAVSYDVTPDATIYANATKGYRIGGYIVPIDLTTGTCPAALAAVGITNPKFSYAPDSLWSYETGAKTTWFDNRLSVNGSAYYVDWNNVQQSFALACGSEYTANFGHAVSYGGELEIRARPMHGLTLGLEAGYTHATLTSVVPNVGATVGEKLLNTPDWTATFYGSYDWDLSPDATAYIRADYDWTGRSHGTFNNRDPAFSRPVYGLLNGSVGARFGNFDVSLFAKNLLNEQKTIQIVTIELLETAYVPRPLTVGVRAAANF